MIGAIVLLIGSLLIPISIIIPLLVMGYFYKSYIPKNEFLRNGWVKFGYCAIAPIVAALIALAFWWFLVDVKGITFGITAGQLLWSINSWTGISYLFVYFTIVKSD